jgi:hypothetical protein
MDDLTAVNLYEAKCKESIKRQKIRVWKNLSSKQNATTRKNHPDIL